MDDEVISALTHGYIKTLNVDSWVEIKNLEKDIKEMIDSVDVEIKIDFGLKSMIKGAVSDLLKCFIDEDRKEDEDLPR